MRQGRPVPSSFRLLRPATVAEASAALAERGEQARVYAGGAELLLLMRTGIVSPDYLVDIKHIGGLDRLAWDGAALRIGACVTHRVLEHDPLVREHAPVLAAAEARVGNIRVRNQGTLGGNLCFADPHADPGTALLVYDAFAEIEGGGGSRTMTLDEFFLGSYAVALEPDELLVAVTVRPLSAGWNTSFQRVERFYRPTLNVAAAARASNGRIDEARLAVGCVGPRPMRVPFLEDKVRGLTPDEAVAMLRSDARAHLIELLEPVDDLLGSADYKIHIATVLLGRALAAAAVQGRTS